MRDPGNQENIQSDESKWDMPMNSASRKADGKLAADFHRPERGRRQEACQFAAHSPENAQESKSPRRAGQVTNTRAACGMRLKKVPRCLFSRTV